jgi:hypothetical protein
MTAKLNRDLPPEMTWIPLSQREYFPYTAHALWPGIVGDAIPVEQQIDWVDAVSTMEEWLEGTIGGRYSRWVWAEHLAMTYWHCGVAFSRDQDRTLFLLKWS